MQDTRFLAGGIVPEPLATDVLDLSLCFRPTSGYDQGDCCECTCVSTTSYTCGDEVHGGFECLDPGAPCVDDTDDASSFGSPQSMCNPSFFADGDCDLVNNNEACGASLWRKKFECDITPV